MEAKSKKQKKVDRDETKSSSSGRNSAGKLKTKAHKAQQAADDGYDPPSFDGRIDPDEPLPATSYVSWRIDRPVALRTTKTGPLAQKPITMMTVLKDSANRHPEKVAYASMVDGNWVKLTFGDLLDQVVHAAQGFIKLGLQRFNCVGIIGHNSVEYIVAHLGIIFAGGVSVLLHFNSSDKYTYDLVKTAKCRIILVDSIKERQQVFEWRKKSLHLKHIIQYGKEAFDKADDVHQWEKFLLYGNDVDAEVLVTRTLQQAPNLCCCVLQTTGRTGPPKNVMLSHDNLVWGANTIGRYLTLSDGNGITVNFIPLSSIFGLTVSVNLALRFGTTVYIMPATRNKALVIRMLQGIRPTIFFAPTMFFEYIHREMRAKLERSSLLMRVLMNWAMKIGRKAFDDHTKLARPPAGWSMANRVVFRKVRKHLGMDASNEMIAAGGFMIRSDLEFYLSVNMPLLLAYGLTESSGSHTCCLLDRFRIESVGVGMDGCKTKIANPDASGVGELLIGGRNLAMGYLESEALTTKYFTEDGSFRTGDLARKDAEGFLYIVGNNAEVVTLSGGEIVSTIPLIKIVLSNLPFVSNVVIVGDGKPYLSMMMTIKTEIDEATELPSDRLTGLAVIWFRKLGYDVKTVKDIVPKANPNLLEKIQLIVDRINTESPHESHKIKRWTFLSTEFTTQADELSPTLKVRRWVVLKKYAVTIASMYPEMSLESSAFAHYKESP